MWLTFSYFLNVRVAIHEKKILLVVRDDKPISVLFYRQHRGDGLRSILDVLYGIKTHLFYGVYKTLFIRPPSFLKMTERYLIGSVQGN